MARTELDPGFYPDPAGRADLRWWDGTRWTTSTRERNDHPTGPITPVAPPAGASVRPDSTTEWAGHPPPSGADTWTRSSQQWAPPSPGSAGLAGGLPGVSEPRRARAGRTVALIAAGLAIVAVGATVAILLQLRDDVVVDLPVADAGSDAGGTVADEPPATSGDGPPEDAGPADDPPDAPEAQEDDLLDEPGADEEPEALEDEQASDDPPIRIDFDGQCEVIVPLSLAQEERLRAWDFPECIGAPVSLARAQERWIVVISSLNGDDFTASDAFERAARVVGDGVLWSSHYPSLNPNLWVVFDGPYNDESSARDAANRRGDGAYQRVLSDDEGDRYCLSADGCIGERGR